jgi:hypothetical protein
MWHHIRCFQGPLSRRAKSQAYRRVACTSRAFSTTATLQIWERRRRIPSQLYNDPLQHLFDEFDADGDGHLTAEEIAGALKSNGVSITADQVQVFIDTVDANGNKTIERSEFADLIFHMATADLNKAHHAPRPTSEDPRY